MDDVQTSKKKMPSKKEWRGFYSLILIQAQNAFNEKAAQFLLIPLKLSPRTLILFMLSMTVLSLSFK